jgi:hypothetical protein
MELWDAFKRAGVMVFCIGYDGPDEDYGPGYLLAQEGEVIYCPENVPLVMIPDLVSTNPAPDWADPQDLAAANAEVAGIVLREVIRRTGIRFRFTGENLEREFIFDGPNPTVQVEPDKSDGLDDMPVTVVLTPASGVLLNHELVTDGDDISVTIVPSTVRG